MNPGPIPKDVVAFIFERIQSVEQLEILLFLFNRPGEAWTVEALNRELRSSPRSVARWLKNLKAQRLISELDDKSYAYQPDANEFADGLANLRHFYSERRVSIIELIFNKPASKMQSFAAAFRVREDDPDG